MSQTLQYFGMDLSSGARKITHINATPIGIGLGVSLQNDNELILADGNFIYGIVTDCQMLGKDNYLITVCTFAESIAVRVKDGNDTVIGDVLTFSLGEIITNDTGTYVAQKVGQNLFIEDGVTKKAAVNIKFI